MGVTWHCPVRCNPSACLWPGLWFQAPKPRQNLQFEGFGPPPCQKAAFSLGVRVKGTYAARNVAQHKLTEQRWGLSQGEHVRALLRTRWAKVRVVTDWPNLQPLRNAWWDPPVNCFTLHYYCVTLLSLRAIQCAKHTAIHFTTDKTFLYLYI